MVMFKSLIVFDLETTGLPKYEHNTTRITELAFLGCEIEHIKDSLQLPRVLHKLVLCFNPLKMIHPDSSSGLDNELLQNVKPFTKEDAEVLKHFISRLPPPVCLVAHNGIEFDFPILRKQLDKLNVSLPNHIYCADSLSAFRHLYPTDKWKNKGDGQSNRIKHNETTPQRQTTKPINSLNYKMHHNYEGHEIRNIKPDICRELFLEECSITKKDHNSDDWNLNESSNQNKSPKSHKLKDIYYFFHKVNFPDAHRAEEDSKALLSCIMKCDIFLNWLNENAIIFNSIEPLF